MGNLKPKLKVCGMIRLEEIDALIDLSIDYIGFIFYPKSPRYVLNHLTLEQIDAIEHPNKVGVFVNETLENIRDISEKANLNYIQVHGDETIDFITELREELDDNVKIIKAIRIGNDLDKVKSELKHLNSNKDFIAHLLFDTDSSAYGGTGNTFDWQILDELDIPLPYFLSGGISLENVEKIQNNKNQPFALDVNSKFELEPGVKDLSKIKELKKKI